MLAGGDWLPNLLLDLQTRAHISLILALPLRLLPVATTLAKTAAALATVAYFVYLHDCYRKGFYISPAKIVLPVVTFGVMYVAYTPNPLILGLVPAWNFKVGFAVIGIFFFSSRRRHTR